MGLTAGALLAALVATPARGAAYTLDFDFAPDGSQATNRLDGIYDQYDASGIYQGLTLWQDLGVTITGFDKRGNEAPLLLFNSNEADYYKKGNRYFYDPGKRSKLSDDDLLTGTTFGTPNQGNVLILHERGFNRQGAIKQVEKPDDSRNGGTFSFNFENLVSLNTIQLLDIDDFGSRGNSINVQ
jgi:hypothetical protein